MPVERLFTTISRNNLGKALLIIFHPIINI